MKPVLALQIYSVRDAYANDKRSTLQKTKAMGYDAVELFGAMDTPAEQIREMLDSCGLKVAGYHTAWSWLDDEHFDATVEYNKAIGNDKIIIPWIDDCMKNSQQAWEKTNELFSAMSEKLATVRMRFGFHSHACEHTLLDGGSYGWKLFCDGTPDSVITQLDLGNCMNGGFDPIDEYEKCAKRAVTVHFKPFSKTTGYESYIGTDDIDWNKAVKLAQDSGVCEYIIVEYEKQDDFAGVKICAEAMKKLL